MTSHFLKDLVACGKSISIVALLKILPAEHGMSKHIEQQSITCGCTMPLLLNSAFKKFNQNNFTAPNVKATERFNLLRFIASPYH